MKHVYIYTFIILLLPTFAFADANCTHSNSWQCQQRSQQTGSASSVGGAGISPTITAPSGTTTIPLGSLPTEHHNVVLVPVTGTPGPTISGYAPVPQADKAPSFTGATPQALPAPNLLPQKTPPQPIIVTSTPSPTISGYSPVPQASKVPSFTGSTPQASPVSNLPPQKTPPQPITVTGTPGPTISGYSAVPQANKVPSFTGATPQPLPQATATNAQKLTNSIQGTQPSTQKGFVTHQLVVHQPPSQKPITSGHHNIEHPYSLEFIEPGIQNHKVEVYRSKDVQQVLYSDTIPQDSGGFHLRIIGIRNPDYSH